MQKIKYRISLDMLEVASQTTVKAKKGDTACSIVMTLTENGKIYHIADGCRAVFSGKKSDGNYLFNGETCRIEDNTIIYDFTEQTVAIEGIVLCEVILYKDNEQLTTPRFNILVGATVYNGEEIVSTPEADALKEFIEDSENRVNSIIEKSENVIEEVEEVHRNSNQYFTNAIKGTASGTEVCIKDISPIPHNIGVKLSNADAKLYKGGKNLVKPDYYSKSSNTFGMEITLNPDGSVTFNGTAEADKWFYFYSAEKVRKFPKGKYFLSGCPKGGSNTKYRLACSKGNDFGDGLAFELTADTNLALNFCVFKGQTLNNVTIRPQIEMGTVGTEWEPYIEPTECVVNDNKTANVPSLYPSTRLFTDTDGVTIEVEYSRDINKAFAELQQAVAQLSTLAVATIPMNEGEEL